MSLEQPQPPGPSTSRPTTNPWPLPSASPPQQLQHNITLTTPRLLLRPVLPTDLSTLHSFRRSPTVMAHMGSGPDPEPNVSKSATPAKLAGHMTPGTRFTMAVELRDPPPSTNPGSHTCIGFVGCGHRTSETFYLFGEEYWGKGYATEAFKAWLECYWREFPRGLQGATEEEASYLTAGFLEGNEASGKVMQKVGMREVARLRPGDPGYLTSEGHGRVAVIYRIERPVPEDVGR